ncbi:MAG: energy transducer TonB [Bacteroidetes bacterium]|nr:energy transducer TonB [Bacteroidota bacterium]
MFAQDKAKLQKADESGFIEVDKLPALKTQLKPHYPEIARLAGIEGTVYLKILVDENGNVEKAKVEQGAKDMLDNSALEAAKKAKFSPAMVNDKPVKVWVILPVAFKLAVEKKDEDVSKQVQPGENEDPGINEFVKVEKLPEIVEAAKPDYPEAAKKAGIEAKVFVKVLIGKDGNPKKAIVIKSENEIFNQSAIDAALKSKFTSAINKGEKIAVWVVLPYKFTLDMSEAEIKTFDDVNGAKKYFQGFIEGLLNLTSDNYKNAERIQSSLSYGDESALFKVMGENNSKYTFVTRKGRQVLAVTMNTLEDIEKAVTTRMDKMFKVNKGKGESEIFDSTEKAKEYYNGFTSLYGGSAEKRTRAGVVYKDIKFEKIVGKISFGDESGLYRVTKGGKTKYYDFIAREGNKIYKYAGANSIKEIQKYADGLKKKAN